jgi:UDP-glucose:glycoprotein glucosyltransferase
MASLTDAGLTSEQAFRVLTNAEIGKAATQSSPTDGIFDASDREEGGKAIVWLNDIEKDKRCVYQPFDFVVFIDRLPVGTPVGQPPSQG